MLATALLLCLAGSALLAPPKAGACTLIELCVETDSAGTATLKVPPLSLVALVKPEVKPYEDCIWEEVDVDFGDGSAPATYYWDASQGLTGSHTFPKPGEYPVHIQTNEGHHAKSVTKPPASCPDLPIDAKVVFPAPPPPPEEPKPKPPKKEKEKEKEMESPSKGGSGGDNSGDNSGGSGSESGQGKQPGSGKAAYWRHCSGDVLAHRVGCRKGRSVIRVASKRLDAPGTAEVSGFQCRLRAQAGRPISCRSAAARLLGPLG